MSAARRAGEGMKSAKRGLVLGVGAVATARRTGRELAIGYILRHHRSCFIELAHMLGYPMVFRMNFCPHSFGPQSEVVAL